MEIKKTKITKFKNVRVKDGYEEKTSFIAIDGKKFDNQEKCENYETSLINLEEAKKEIEVLNFDEKLAIAVVVFGAEHESENIDFFMFKVDENKVLKQKKYLSLLGCNNISEEILYLHRGQYIVICSYEVEYRDYPTSYYKEVKTVKEFNSILNDFYKKSQIEFLTPQQSE